MVDKPQQPDRLAKHRKVARKALRFALNGKTPTPAKINKLTELIDEWVSFYRSNFDDAANYETYAHQKEAVKAVRESSADLLRALSDPKNSALIGNLYGALDQLVNQQREIQTKGRQKGLLPQASLNDLNVAGFYQSVGNLKTELQLLNLLSRRALQSFNSGGQRSLRIPTQNRTVIKNAFAVDVACAYKDLTGNQPKRATRKRTNDKGAIHSEPYGPWHDFLVHLMKAVLDEATGADGCSQHAISQLKQR